MLHLHALLYHPGMSRKQVKKTLMSIFGEPRRVSLIPVRGGGLKKNIMRIISYSTDVLSGKSGGWQKLRDLYGIELPEVLANWICSIESIRKGGMNGLRFDYGLSKRANLRGESVERFVEEGENQGAIYVDEVASRLGGESGKQGVSIYNYSSEEYELDRIESEMQNDYLKYRSCIGVLRKPG